MRVTPTLLSVVCQVLFYPEGLWASWDDWWAYEGISGPDFWGLLNPEWSLCSKGRRQSPVDIKPPNLLYDPHLRPLQVGKNRVSGTLMNSGHSVVFRSDFTEPDTRINISGGPLSYSFSFEEIHLRFGLSDKEGSEHTIAGHGYPAELQILGYNTDLFSNMSEALALQRSEGIVGIAVMLQVGNLSNSELRLLSAPLHNLIYQGQSAYLESLSVRELLPDTDFFMTYEGSLTMPGCYETVTWIVMNKPIYITKQQLYVLRKLQKGNEENPKAPLANNFRPTQPLNQRIVRTNIDFKRLNGRSCPTMYRDMQYSSILVVKELWALP